MARAHRELAGSDLPEVDFAAFAASLGRMTCLEAGQPADRIEIDDRPLPVPFEVATSLGAALAECLAWILRQQPSGTTRVRLRPDAGRLRLLISHAGEPGAEAVALAPAAFMFRAMVEQLGAGVSLSMEAPDGPGLEIAVPLVLDPSAAREPAVTLH